MPEPSAPAWHRLVLENRGLVYREARRTRWPSRIPIEDIVAYGNVGITVSAQAYDPARGARFSTYATHVIRQKIAEGLRTTPCGPIATPRGAFDDDASPEVRDAALKVQKTVSLSGPAGDSYRRNAAAAASPLEALCRAEAEERIAGIISRLRPREREVIRCRFYEQLTLRETGERIGVSKDQARQIQVQALARIGKLLGGRPRD